MLGNVLTNNTGPDSIPRAEGSMLYLPVGDGGFLVYFGGVQLPYGNSTIAAVSTSDPPFKSSANQIKSEMSVRGCPGGLSELCLLISEYLPLRYCK